MTERPRTTTSVALTPVNRQRLREVSVSTLTTCLYRAGVKRVCPLGIVPLSKDQPRMVGEAYTLRFVPMREDVSGEASYGSASNVHQRAFEECPEGHVLVMDTRSETRGCSCGDLLIGRLKARGCAGIVTDGGFRDTPDIAALNFPAYQRCSVPTPSFGFLQAMEANVPIGCGDIAVYPGDIIVGDPDGIVVIPAPIANQIAEQAYEQTDYETFASHEVARGRSVIGLYPATDQSRADYQNWRRRCDDRG
jgi:regulator of RNase E activity RraA